VGDPAGEAEVGFFMIVKITFLPAESKCLERKLTVKFSCANYIEKATKYAKTALEKSLPT
jgi:hypothetical protein